VEVKDTGFRTIGAGLACCASRPNAQRRAAVSKMLFSGDAPSEVPVTRVDGPGVVSDGDGKNPSRLRRKGAHRLWLRTAWFSAVLLFALAALFHLGGGWYFASTLNERGISGESRRNALVPRYTIEVLAVQDDQVTLRKPGEERLARTSTYGLTWEGGWGVLGEVVGQQSDGSVVRSFTLGGGRPLHGGERVALDTRVYPNDPRAGLGLGFEDIQYHGELGDYPAWFLQGTGAVWFIFVHGNGMTPRDGLRVLPSVVAEGMPALIITYRNDEGAPPDPGGHLTYGKHEWRDLEAAVQYALDHGAQSVVIDGMSMGGAVTIAFLTHSPLAAAVSGVILDAPLLSFKRTVEFQAEDQRLPVLGWPLPRTLVWSAEWLASARYGVDWEFTDYLDEVGGLSAPILLIHGTIDSDVPIATSRELAKARPDLVYDFYEAAGAEHTAAWNLDPAEYDRRVRAFLEDVIVR